ncbi:unnamed protein product [Adineta steineri]|uniref:Uncharacterized protein n=1 Tax=Adineta steineri TaxID=433720 RepID=A0A814JZJ3_9BILA|nr:unnamed protein product [Adineta steineri]CAF1045424.1 unnamed protein product [Adineta steineri]
MADKLLSIENENLEDLTVVWLDKNAQDLNTKTRLRCIINFLKIFNNISSCLDYIRARPNENIFLIVSGQLSSLLFPFIENLSQILHVYIFCQNSEKYLLLKSSGVFTNQELLYDQLSKDANQFYATHSITISYPTEKSLRDLAKETGTFFWFQLFITALLDMPSSDKGKEDLLELARTFYADNDLELRRIKHFEQTYKESQALIWYTNDSFLYRLLNKAIRTENIDLLFACRFFITDLYRELHSLHRPYIELIRSCEIDEHTVYDGQLMISDDFTKLKANIGKLISINSFLSTSIDPQVALVYAGNKGTYPIMESVLFQITINVNESSDLTQYPFADISAYSSFKDEQEVLFSLTAIFRVEDISKRSDNVWLVKMVFLENTPEIEEMRKLSSHLKSHQGQTNMVDLADLLYLMGNHSRAISFCQKFLSENHDNWSLAISCYCIMGQAYASQPELALQTFEKALELQLQYNSTDYYSCATMYNNMGFAHNRLQSDKQVTISYYERALEICTSISDKEEADWCLMATILNNLVTSHSDEDIDLALKREHLVLDIRLKYLPLSHPLVATTHSTLAQIYSTKGEYKEASIHYDEALYIMLKYLPNNHPSISSIHHSVGLHYLFKGDYEMNTGHEAASKISYEKSLKLSCDALDYLSSGDSSTSIDYDLFCYCTNTCGVVYMRLARLDDAIKCFDKLITTINEHLSANHQLHIAFLRNRGKIFTLHGEKNKSMEFYERAIRFCDQTGLENSFEKAQVYLNIAEWYELFEQKDLAVQYYEYSMQLGTEYMGTGHPLILWCEKGLERLKSIVTIPAEEASWL